MTRDQTIYVNRDPVSEGELVAAIEEAYAEAPDKPLFVKGDVAAPYGRVVDVVNAARDAGVERIGLLVDREQREGGGQ